MTAEWHWDDPEAVPDEDVLLRRVRRIPDCVIRNLTTRTAELKSGALIFDEGDGMSVHRDSVRSSLQVPRVDVCDWDRYHAVEFETAAVRSARKPEGSQTVQVGGVIHQDDVDDELMGTAHALVRTRSATQPKAEKRAIRDRIIDSYRWVQEDPNCPEG